MLLDDAHAEEVATNLLMRFNDATETYEALKDILKHEERNTDRYELIRNEYLKAAEHARIRYTHALFISCEIIQSIQSFRWN